MGFGQIQSVSSVLFSRNLKTTSARGGVIAAIRLVTCVVSGLMNCTSQAVAILRPEQGTAPWVRTPLGRESALFACE